MKKGKSKKRKKSTKKTSWLRVFAGYGIPLLLGVFVLAADQLSKFLVHENIPMMTHEAQWYPYDGIGVFENFFGIECSIVHAINFGAAWGVFSGYQFPLLVLRILLIMGLCVYLIVYNVNRALVIPFILVISGAIGNILDYYIYGHVVDMIHLVFWGYDYPVFNIADSAIFIGMASLALISWLQNKDYAFSKS